MANLEVEFVETAVLLAIDAHYSITFEQSGRPAQFQDFADHIGTGFEYRPPAKIRAIPPSYDIDGINRVNRRGQYQGEDEVGPMVL